MRSKERLPSGSKSDIFILVKKKCFSDDFDEFCLVQTMEERIYNQKLHVKSHRQIVPGFVWLKDICHCKIESFEINCFYDQHFLNEIKNSRL